MQEYENIRRREFVNEFSYKLKLKNSIRKYNYYLGLAGISMILLLVFHSCGKEEGENEPKLLLNREESLHMFRKILLLLQWVR